MCLTTLEIMFGCDKKGIYILVLNESYEEIDPGRKTYIVRF